MLKKNLRAQEVKRILKQLKQLGSAADRLGMARYGINIEQAFGVSVYELRKIAKTLGTDHQLALDLWATKNHEARLLAVFIAEPLLVTKRQMEAWAKDFDSWDICDQATTSLFDLTPHAFLKALTWVKREPLWVKRAGLALMAGLAVHAKNAKDQEFKRFLKVLTSELVYDQRNFVKKAFSWALRNIGKRNVSLNRSAQKSAHIIQARALRERLLAEKQQSVYGKEAINSALWVARDALKELTSASVQARLAKVKSLKR